MTMSITLKHLKVGAVQYDIQYTSRPGPVDAELPYYGYFMPRAQTIQIWDELTPSRRFVTLLHETIHAIEDDRQLDLPEETVDALARGLAAVLIDNGLVTP